MAKKDETIILDVQVKGLESAAEEIGKAEEATKTLKQQFIEAKKEVDKLAASNAAPEDLDEAIKKMADLKDRVSDVNEQVKIFASGSKYEQVSNSFKSIGGAVGNLDFGKAQERALAFANAAKTISFGDAIKSVKQLGQTMLTVGKAILANPIFLIAALVIGIVMALKKLFDELGLTKKIMEAVGKAIDFLLIPVKALIQGLKDLTDWFGWTSHAANDAAQSQADALTKTADAAKKKSEEVVQGIDTEIKLAEAQGKNTESLQRKKLKTLREVQLAQYAADQAAYQAAIQKGELDAEEIAALKEKARLSRLAAKQSADDIKVFEEQVKQKKIKDAEDEKKRQEDLTNKEKEERGKRSQDAQKRREEERRKQQQFDAERLSALRLTQDLALQLMDEGVEKELAVNRTKYARLLQDLEANEKLNGDEKIAIRAQYEQLAIDGENKIKEADRLKREAEATAEGQKEIDLRIQSQALVNQYIADEQAREIADRQLIYDQELIALQTALDNELITQEQYNQLLIQAEKNKNDDLEKINDDYRKAELAAEKQLNDQKIQGVSNALSMIGNLAELFNNGSEKSAERAFKIQKGVQIAQATIDTFKSATSAFSSLSGIPVVGPALGAVAAAAAVAAGLANIKKIAATKFEKNGGGSVPSAPSTPEPVSMNAVSSPIPPSLFGTAGSTTGGGEQQSGLRQQSTVIRAVVVESDVTDTQNRMATYQNRAEIG
jgi:hypothetical protein